MRQGGSQELLSTGGFMGGQPPAKGKILKLNRVQDVFYGDAMSINIICVLLEALPLSAEFYPQKRKITKKC